MDAFIFNQIINDRDYLDWKAMVGKLNKEYHDKLYYGGDRLLYDGCEYLKCKKCNIILWNWRTEEYIKNVCKIEFVYSIGHIFLDDCFAYKMLSITLPKNY